MQPAPLGFARIGKSCGRARWFGPKDAPINKLVATSLLAVLSLSRASEFLRVRRTANLRYRGLSGIETTRPITRRGFSRANLRLTQFSQILSTERIKTPAPSAGRPAPVEAH